MNNHSCAACGQTGKNGAQFILLTDGEETALVHRPCGERLAMGAPDDTTVEVVHRAVLRRRKEEAMVRSFWEKKFTQAIERSARKATKLREA